MGKGYWSPCVQVLYSDIVEQHAKMHADAYEIESYWEIGDNVEIFFYGHCQREIGL